MNGDVNEALSFLSYQSEGIKHWSVGEARIQVYNGVKGSYTKFGTIVLTFDMHDPEEIVNDYSENLASFF